MHRGEVGTSSVKDARHNRRGRRAIRALLASIAILCGYASGCASAPRNEAKAHPPLPATHADDRRTLDLILAPFQMPDVRDLKLVVHCVPGSGIRPAPEWPPRETMVAGWLIESSGTEVRLLTADGLTVVFGGKRDDPNAPAPYLSFERHCDTERGSWTTVEFEEAIRCPDQFVFGYAVSGGVAYPVRDAIFAHWAFQRGNEKLAEELLTRIRDLAAEKNTWRLPPTWQDLLGMEILQWCRRCTNAAARLGAPRKDLLEFWKRFEGSASPTIAQEAGAMVRAYASLIEEDGKFVEPSAKELAAMTPGSRAEYWVHKIRDLDSDGAFDESDYFYFEDTRAPLPGDPVQELLSLAEEARSALAAHRKDGRPTRVTSSGHPLSYEQAPLMTCGEVCQLLLYALDRRSRHAK